MVASQVPCPAPGLGEPPSWELCEAVRSDWSLAPPSLEEGSSPPSPAQLLAAASATAAFPASACHGQPLWSGGGHGGLGWPGPLTCLAAASPRHRSASELPWRP